jgi:DNA mismatch repair protein MutS2
MDIYKRSLRALEWDKLKKFLSGFCQTTDGKQESLESELYDELSIVQTLLGETEEAHALLEDKSLPSLLDLPDIKETLIRLKADASLNVNELWNIRSVLSKASLLKSSFASLTERGMPRLNKWIEQIQLVKTVRNAIELAIDDQGNVRDEASTELRALRQAHAQIQATIQEQLGSIIHSSASSKLLQEPLYTQRNGRYVVPVIASMRISFPGIVHDTSASGLTVYIEPASIIALSNNLRIKEAEIEHEIETVLTILTGFAKDRYDDIAKTYRAIIELDKIFARARLSTAYSGVVPLLSEDGQFQLYDARHPLLILQDPSRQVVANDVTLGMTSKANSDHGQTLVITGPNTGGKTVLLKTIGLLSLMLKAGLMLPVKCGSTARLFKDIYADIGDDQSLEQSLSTFSSHLQNIKQIVNEANTQSLVLLDEIGGGTDPREGAALAQSILEYLNRAGTITIVSTHLSELKTMGYTDSNFVNASFAFDDVNLIPTYRLRIGVPGSSHAITIAQNLGLNQAIIKRTNELLENLKNDRQYSIDLIEKRLGELKESQENAQAYETKASELYKLYEIKLQQLEAEGDKLKRVYADKLANELQESRNVIRELTAQLQKQPTLARLQAAQMRLKTLKEEGKWSDQPSSGLSCLDQSQNIKIGQALYIPSLNKMAVVESLPKEIDKLDNPTIQLRAGNVRIKVPLSDLRASPVTVGNAAKKRKRPIDGVKQIANNLNKVPHEQESTVLSTFVRTELNTLDLRGQRVEKALSSLSVFLDAGARHHVSPLMVIHGHGTGALKAAVREELSNTIYKITFRPGDHIEGGDGVTLIFL